MITIVTHEPCIIEVEAGPEELPTEKGLKEKKRKLHETLQRIILFYVSICPY